VILGRKLFVGWWQPRGGEWAEFVRGGEYAKLVAVGERRQRDEAGRYIILVDGARPPIEMER
jgi:hypothetical protein